MRKVLIGKKIKCWAAGMVVVLLSSCLGGSDDSYEVEIPTDCQIAVFSLSHDSIPAFGTAKFTIDQLGKEIFNIDSLPRGTVIEGIKVACTIQTVNVYAVSQIRIVQTATGDTLTLKSKTESNAVKWTAEDSVDFSQPLEIILNGIDGVTARKYKAWVNIHQQEPEELVWSLWQGSITGLERLTEYDGNYYCVPDEKGLRISFDGASWGSVSGGENWKYLLGSAEGGFNQPAFLAGIAQTDEGEVFAWLDEKGFGQGDAVPDTFPRTGFGKVNYTAGHCNCLLLAGGRAPEGYLSSDCWSTSDGKIWAILTDARRGSSFSAREGCVVVNYDNKLWLFGGRDDNGLKDDLYISYDRGLNWELPPAEVTASPSYITPSPSSWAVPAPDGLYFLLFDPPNVWRVGINRLLWRVSP
ncbi:MAG: DUF6242 domain-containing protein [Tannerellaceae bacterium]|jgi:hypothetical protein|nr:DUF6242 domain-containing protein [Tannerellaceae bacterium]